MASNIMYAVGSEGHDDLVTILTEDGGIVEIHHNGERFVSTYIQDRCDGTFDEDMWLRLAESKQYLKDWDESIVNIDQDMIEDALDWLHPQADEFVLVDFDFLTNKIVKS